MAQIANPDTKTATYSTQAFLPSNPFITGQHKLQHRAADKRQRILLYCQQQSLIQNVQSFASDGKIRILGCNTENLNVTVREYLGVKVENSAVKLAIFLGTGPQAYRQLTRCWGIDLASNDLVGIVGEPTHPDRAVRGELIGLTEKGIDLLTRVIPYLSI